MSETESVCLKMCGMDKMDGSLVMKILESAGRFRKDTGCMVYPRYFNEPTRRDDFVEIIEKQFELGLTFDSFWFPTDGSGLASLPDSKWKRLAETGWSWLRLHFHHISEEHDRFLGKPGAWHLLSETARRAEEHSIDWYPVIFINKHNAHRYEEIRSAVERVGSPSLPAGWMVPNWQNNPRYDINRVSYSHISHLVSEKSIWKSEKDIIQMIDSDRILSSSKAFNSDCGVYYLGCLPNGDVYYAGGCHGEPFTQHRDRMILGSFKTGDSIEMLLDRAIKDPPEEVKVLSGVTFGELAEKYGNPQSDLVYRIQDLVVNKWGAMYLNQIDPSGT